MQSRRLLPICWLLVAHQQKERCHHIDKEKAAGMQRRCDDGRMTCHTITIGILMEILPNTSTHLMLKII
jgi:hypothetical protein